jgi:flagellin-specific chaperone FliS
MYAPNVSRRRGKVCNTKAINAVSLETAIKTVLTEKINDYLSSGNTAKKVFSLLKNNSTEERKTVKKRIDEFNNNIRVLLNKAANPNLSEDLSSIYENDAQECVDCRKTYESRLAELDKILSKVDEVQKAFSEYSECLTMDEIFSSYEISRTIIGAFIEQIVVDDSNDDIEVIFKNNKIQKEKNHGKDN